MCAFGLLSLSSNLIGLNVCHAIQYEWILFDADDTLFHFDAFRGLQITFSKYRVDFKQKDYDEYQRVNRALWVQFQQGLIRADDVKTKRFQAWAEILDVSPSTLNSEFLSAMAEISTPLDGAYDLIKALKNEKVKIGIITNGFSDLQWVRLERTGLKQYFDVVVVSEEVGVAKPDKRIFEHTLNAMGDPDPSKVLMVGDTLETDIVGGSSVGMTTCWLNTKKLQTLEKTVPTFQVSSLKELEDILLLPSPEDVDYKSQQTHDSSLSHHKNGSHADSLL
jgi:YjjG family noncanonical pyrimidine nucleotidase